MPAASGKGGSVNVCIVHCTMLLQHIHTSLPGNVIILVGGLELLLCNQYLGSEASGGGLFLLYKGGEA